MTDDPGRAELSAALERCWTRLEALPVEAVLATLAPRGAEARVVMLRRSDRAAGAVMFHADLQSPKIAEISQAPGATLLIWDRKTQLQLRLRVSLRCRTAAAALWSALPEAAQGNYGTEPPPGTPIPAPGAYRRRPDPSRFGEIAAGIAEIDMVELGGATDRRALFRRADDWQGEWLAP